MHCRHYELTGTNRIVVVALITATHLRNDRHQTMLANIVSGMKKTLRVILYTKRKSWFTVEVGTCNSRTD